MTKKDYELIARVLAEVRPVLYAKRPSKQYEMADAIWAHFVTRLAHALSATSSRFDYNKFVSACQE